MPGLYLVDGTNLLYRAYHALGGMRTGAGVPSNAVFGFLNMILKLRKDERPDALVTVFDPPGPTLKHKLFEGYKANREKPPDDFLAQIPYVHRALKALGLPLVQVSGVEADDVIGTLASEAVKRGDVVVVVTGDKDFCQLVGPSVTLLDTMKGVRTDTTGVSEKMGVPPEKVIDVLALAGDAVDNLPGAPGIGIKTAAKLVTEYGSLEAVIQNAVKIGGKKGEAIASSTETLLRNRPLVTIETALDLPLSSGALEASPLDREGAAALFRELEFRKFLADLNLADVPVNVEPHPAVLPVTPPRLGELPLGRPPLPEGWWAVLPDGDSFVAVDGRGVTRGLGEGVFLPPGAKAAGHGLKSFAKKWGEMGLLPGRIAADTEIAAYLLNPGRRSYEADTLMDERSIEKGHDVAGRGAALLLLASSLETELERNGLQKLYRDIELPLVGVLAAMELKGIKVDLERLAALSKEYEGRISALEGEMFAMVGGDFNPRSTKDLSRILFEKLNLPVLRRTATGNSTDAAVLEELSLMHPFPGLLIEHRGLTKLKNSFIDTLPGLVDPADGRIHTTFMQSVAATGRLSSVNPNLQNIPVRGEEGKRIRAAFVAEQGKVLVSADYSQIEFRILAHMCRDKALLDMFATGRDIHAETACRLFDVGPFGVTSDMRRQAKIVNFGILYGMSAFGLARRLGTDLASAKKMIDTYFARFPGVRAFLDGLVADARRTGAARTLFGRVRLIPDLDSRNRNLREAAERLAVNTPIQGTAADVVKIAMIRADRALSGGGGRGAMLLQVHDELLVEAPASEADNMSELLKNAMEGAADFTVPLKVETGSGTDWLTAH